MTLEQAYNQLELPQNTNLQMVRERFQYLHNQLLMQIDGASFKPELKHQKQRHLEALKEAFTLITGDNIDFKISGPYTGKSCDSAVPQNAGFDRPANSLEQQLPPPIPHPARPVVAAAKTSRPPVGPAPSIELVIKRDKNSWAWLILIGIFVYSVLIRFVSYSLHFWLFFVVLAETFAFYWLLRRRQTVQLSPTALFRYGYDLDQSECYDEAAVYVQLAAPMGEPRAAYLLGKYYQAGLGINRNLESAGYWYHKAFEQLLTLSSSNGPIGQTYLGHCYRYGLGTAKNTAYAVEYYRKAAASGGAEAWTALADLYLHGEGVPRDAGEARRWYQKAADSGYEPAKRQLRQL